ncbi:DUF4348 domain-containing protein [Aestuariibaculum sp. M13]|uniref:DUF4348 domain-containing protein n=1 Tax=unclassified Aestuariibaculum TaxID=2646735 RepID=UPI002159E34C|nr:MULTISPECIES: DUF4348 domain-containing protein [unclassified Aestuariibaculum]MCR8667527.1 DUF4348 domain-containing protein [Aestuariibaculum sp. M13]WMI65237.1 DUF4348 domain-containing protein [Aestuariibaculum sp. YM273]
MKKVKLIIILSFLFLISCINKDRENKEKTFTSSNVENMKNDGEEKVQNKESFKNCNETFDEFFERFSRDSIFQKSRVHYPLKWYFLADNESSKLSLDIINRVEDYDYIDFTMDSQSDKYEVVYEREEKSVNYILKGSDSGVFMTYKFKTLDECWYMFEIIDEST